MASMSFSLILEVETTPEHEKKCACPVTAPFALPSCANKEVVGSKMFENVSKTISCFMVRFIDDEVVEPV
jgi:hypothetical protein